MDCPTCGTACDLEDNFCGHCGASLPGARLPMVIQRPGLPVPWHEVRRGLVRATAALVVGTAIELMRRQVRRHVSPAALADRVEGLVARRRAQPATSLQSSTSLRVPIRVASKEPMAPDARGDDVDDARSRSTNTGSSNQLWLHERASEMTIVGSYFFQRIRVRR